MASESLAELLGVARSCDCGAIGGHPICRHCTEAVRELFDALQDCVAILDLDEVHLATYRLDRCADHNRVLERARSLLPEEKR